MYVLPALMLTESKFRNGMCLRDSCNYFYYYHYY